MAGSVRNLDIAHDFKVSRVAVIEETVGPGFLRSVLGMDHIREEKEILRSVKPASVRRQHTLVLPSIGKEAEFGEVGVRVIGQARRVHEDRIREHVDVVRKSELVDLAVVGSAAAFDDIALGALHGPAIPEYGDGILGVVVQISGPQHVAVLVLELDDVSPEFCQILVDVIFQAVPRQLSSFLKNLDMAYRIDFLRVHVPQSRVADEVGVVMEELGGAGDLSETFAVLVEKLHGFCADKTHEGILLRLFRSLGGKLQGRKKGRGEGQKSSQHLPLLFFG